MAGNTTKSCWNYKSFEQFVNSFHPELGSLFIYEKKFIKKSDMLPCQFFLIKNMWGSLNKFPDFFRMGTFIDSTLMKL